MTAERIADLVTRSLSAEREVASVSRARTIYSDRIALSVVDAEGARWRLHIMREPWSRPA